MIRVTNERTLVLQSALQLEEGVTGTFSHKGNYYTLSTTTATDSNGADINGIIKANQRVTIALGKLKPFKYRFLVQVNPALFPKCNVQVQTLYEIGEQADLTLYIQAYKQLDLYDLPYLVRIYMIVD
jgi:hypothetical protein